MQEGYIFWQNNIMETKRTCSDVRVITAWSMYVVHDNQKFTVIIDLPPHLAMPQPVQF